MFIRKLVITIIVIMFIGLGSAQVVLETECMEDLDSPACQDPVFTDDQDEYLYDLGASWVLNNGHPDTSGPTVFQGGEAGNLMSREQDEVTGESKEEFYIEDAGEAEDGAQEEWGRGTLSSTDLSINDATGGQGEFGQRLINPPNEDQCGDGLQNTGQSPATCPEDYGTPDVTLDDQPSPSRTAFYDSTGSISETLPDDDAPSINTHVDGSSGGDPDFHSEGSYVDGSPTFTNIYRDDITHSTGSIGSLGHYYISDTFTTDTYSETQDETLDIYEGSSFYLEDPERVCTSVEVADEDQYKEDGFEFTRSEDTVTASGNRMEYDAVDDYESGSASATLDRNSDFDGTNYYECTSHEVHSTACREPEDPPNIFYDEGAEEISVDLGDDQPTQSNPIEIPSEVSNEPDYREDSEGDIIRETVNVNENAGSISHADFTHYWSETSGTVDEYDGSTKEVPELSGDTIDNEYCVQIDTNGHYENVTFDRTGSSFETDVDVYSGGTYYEGEASATVEWNQGADLTNEITECTETETIRSECEDGGDCATIQQRTVFEETNSNVPYEEIRTTSYQIVYDEMSIDRETVCEAGEVDYHSEEPDEEIWEIDERRYGFSYDIFSIDRNVEWGPVNERPEIFDDFPEVEVTETPFGYHTDPEKLNNDGHLSNDPAVSANQYDLIEAGSNFEADRDRSYVSNADGPDGENNMIFAYEEGEGIQGKKGELGNELYEGSDVDFVSEQEIEDRLSSQGCSGDVQHCLFSVDIVTEGEGWSTDPEDSYDIQLD